MKAVWHSPRRRLALGAVPGLAVGLLLAAVVDPGIGVMAGITLAEFVYLVSTAAALLPMDGDATRTNARRADLRPAADEVLVGVAAALAVAAMVAAHLGSSGHAVSAWGALLTAFGVFGAWAAIQITYAQEYAHEYFRAESGIDFTVDDTPDYADFLYFSSAIGMTYGVTDCSATSRRIRAIVLRHALISFLFGNTLLAAAVNLVAGFFGG